MVDFDNALKTALQGATAAYQETDENLHRVVADASQAIGRITKGKVELQLRRADEDFSGTSYALQLVTAGDLRSIVVGRYRVRSGGYPILHGPAAGIPPKDLEDQFAKLFGKEFNVPIPDRESLIKHFMELLSAPDSPPVINIAFLMRRQSQDENE